MSDKSKNISLPNNNQEEISTPTIKIEKKENTGFFQKILDIFSGTEREERVKNRLLKEIRKDLGQLKLKFYLSKKDQVLPAFGFFFYDIYRYSQNFSRFFDIKNHNNTIKILLFDALLNNKQKEIKSKLERSGVEEMIRGQSDPQKAILDVKSLLNEFVKSFDQELVRKINTTYNQIVDLSNIINYDWFFLLHKFDSNIMEGNFNYKPNFEILEGKYISDDIVTINDYIETLNLSGDWKYITEYINMVSEDKGLNDIFKKMINSLKIIKKDGYLTKIVQLITKDPYFRPKEFQSKSKIVQDYIHEYQSEIQNIIRDAIKSINQEKTNKLLMDIFQTTVIVRMKQYTQKLEDNLSSRGVQSHFKFIDPINYLKAFLLDIGKGEIKSRVDLLIIKGAWDTHSHSSEYSSMLEGFTKLSDKIIEFDNRCSEDDAWGRELRRLMVAIKHDNRAKIMLVKLVDKIDAIANQLLHEGISQFVKAGNLIKNLLEDNNLKNPKMIINIHKIKWEFSKDLKTDMLGIYKKLANMVVLLKNYSKPIEIKENPDKEKKE